MFKVLLVDDEILATEYLKNLIQWDDQGFRIVGEARNGKRALELCKNKSVDIVISDIKMPVMDGIELAKELKNQYPAIKVILISAYKDFEYAKSAIQYDVFNYLLKHELTENHLLEELDRVKESISSEAMLNQSHRKYLVKNLIYANEESLYEVKESMMAYGNRFTLMILKSNSSYMASENEDENRFNNSIKLNHLIETIRKRDFKELNYLSDVQISEEYYLMLFGIGDIRSESELDNQIRAANKTIYNAADEVDFWGLRIVTSRQTNLNDIAKTFRHLADTIRYSVFMDFGKCYYVDALPIRSIILDQAQKVSWSIRDQELEELLSHPIEKMVEDMEILFEKVRNPYWSLENLKKIFFQIHQLRMTHEDGGQMIKQWQGIEVRSYSEMVERLVHVLKSIGTKKIESENSDYTSIVKEVIAYVHKHYKEKLTLDLMGEVFELNGVYLGQVFKKEVGITFLKYLTNYRMSIGKELLETTRLPISEVAELSGYTTSQYFSQIFIKYYTMTPQEHRKWGDEGAKKKT